MYRLAPLFCFLLAAQCSLAQQRELDSLNAFIQSYSYDDTIKVKALNALSEQYQWSNFNSSLQYAEQALALAEKLKYQKGIAVAKYLMGHCFWALGDNNIAIERALDAVELGEEENSEAILVESFQVLARSYMDQATIDKAQYLYWSC